MSEFLLQSTITCPECGHVKEETMPTDACQWFYECEGCKACFVRRWAIAVSSARMERTSALRYRLTGPRVAPLEREASCASLGLRTKMTTRRKRRQPKIQPGTPCFALRAFHKNPTATSRATSTWAPSTCAEG